MTRSVRLLALIPALVAALLPAPASPQDGPPRYELQFLGSGSPVALSHTGVVVGARLAGSSYQPLVSVGGAAWSLLPVPPGADSVFPTDVNDAGVAVGVAFTAGNAVAVRWRPLTGGYVVEVLPRLAGDTSSYATAIDNLGRVVGARRALGYVPAASSGWLFSDDTGIVDLQGRFGLWTAPVDISDAGVVITSTERLNLVTGLVDAITARPSGYTAVAQVAINAVGQIAGTAPLGSQSLTVVFAFRYDGVTGWRFLAGSSRYTVVGSLNGRGDVGYGELGPGVYFEGLGGYALWTLLSPAATAAGWSVTGSSVEINDARVIATTGRNSVTGAMGGVLLTPAGITPPPPAPVLTGVPHPATPDAPWAAISLSWTRIAAASAYVVQRRGPGDPGFVTLVDGTIQTIYDDTAVTPRASYTYRVIARGVAGLGAPSNEVTVAAPGVADATPPVVRITSPTPGARVNGIVRVAAGATDAVGVTRMELRIDGTLRATGTGPSLTFDWSTAGLRRGTTHTLAVRALDAAGNVGAASVSVRIR